MSAIRWQQIEPRSPRSTGDPVARMRAELEQSPTLQVWLAARDDAPALLCVNDPHRSTWTRAALEALAGWSARVPGLAWRVLVATGTHRIDATERREFEAQTFGHCGLRIEQIGWHDATDAATLVALPGAEVGGAAPRFHRWVIESRRVFAIGSVEPHYFAGLTGAHKTLTIGCLAREDIARNHAGALSADSEILRLRGNPVYEGVAELVRGLAAGDRSVAALNQVVTSAALVAAAAGDPLESLDRLAPIAESVYGHVLPAAVDVLHLRVPLPLGRSFYQADKALKNNHTAVRDGGAILLEADCPEGVGADHFLSLLRRAPTLAAAQAVVRAEGYRLGDHKAVKLRALTDPAARGIRVAVVARGLDPASAEVCGLRLCESVESALAWLNEAAGPLHSGVVVEDAGMACVTIRQSAQPAES